MLHPTVRLRLHAGVAWILAALVAALITACSGGSSSAPADASNPLVPSPPLATRASGSSNIAFEPGQPDRVWVINPDADTVAVVAKSTLQVIAEIPVQSAPRSIAFAANGQAWVVNRDAATISIIDPVQLTSVRTLSLPPASRPWGIVVSPADQAPWVALEATGEVARIDAQSGQVVARVAVGGQVRHLAINHRGNQLLASRYISAPLPGEASAAPVATIGAQAFGGEVAIIDPQLATVTRRVVLTVSDRPDSLVSARGIPNYLGAAAIAPDDASAWVPSKQDNVMRGRYRDGTALDADTTVRAISSKLVLAGTPAEDPTKRIDLDNSGVASAAVFDPSGRYVYVTLETSRQIAIIAAADGQEVRRLPSGPPVPEGSQIASYAPQGIAISADGTQLAINNFMSRMVGFIDISGLSDNPATGAVPPITGVRTVTTEKLDANVLRGKQLFYDAANPLLARDGYLSCASCHNEGEDDGRTWDMTQLGEGLRNTISLQGRGGRAPLHWSANFDEVQDFERQIRELAGGRGLMADTAYNEGTRKEPLGDAKAGVSRELDALAAYVTSLTTHAASPWRNPDRTLSVQAQEGQSAFNNSGCGQCHGGADLAGDGSQRHDVGTIGPSTRPLAATPGSGVQPLDGIDTPTLRDVWRSAPYLHDGSAATLEDAIRRHTAVSDEAQLGRLAQYLRELGGEE